MLITRALWEGDQFGDHIEKTNVTKNKPTKTFDRRLNAIQKEKFRELMDKQKNNIPIMRVKQHCDFTSSESNFLIRNNDVSLAS